MGLVLFTETLSYSSLRWYATIKTSHGSNVVGSDDFFMAVHKPEIFYQHSVSGTKPTSPSIFTQEF